MKKRDAIPMVAVWASCCAAAWAMDAVKTTSGTVGGRVTSVSPTQVVLEQKTGNREISVNQIISITYDDEPGALRGVRSGVVAAKYEESLAALEKIDLGKTPRKEVAEDVQFYTALCTARLALAGSGTVADAGRMMNAFLQANPDSYHALEAAELVGDLLVASHLYAQAAPFYARLANTPWPDYKMRAGVAIGRAWLAQRNVPEALKAFETVLAIDAKGEMADRQRSAAMLGKARCLAETGKEEEAIKVAQDIINNVDSTEVEVQARAYNTLGTALKKLKRTKEALHAFLHVDLLYSSAADAHAEALANLAELWNAVQQPDRAIKARQVLTEQYENSPWAKP